MATILYTDGRTQEVEPENGTNFSLEELQAIVGGHIEVVPIRDDPTHILVCNDESKLLGLPLNEEATRRAGLPTARERTVFKALLKSRGIEVVDLMDGEEDDFVSGDVLYCRDEQVQ